MGQPLGRIQRPEEEVTSSTSRPVLALAPAERRELHEARLGVATGRAGLAGRPGGEATCMGLYERIIVLICP